MNPDIKHAFGHVKPLCDAVMACPTQQNVGALLSRISELKSGILQDMQLYLLFPVVTHLKSKELKSKTEIRRLLVEVMKAVLEKVKIDSVEVYGKYHTCLLTMIFDNTKPGMVADTAEELKLSVIQCLVVLMLNTEPAVRAQLFTTHVPLMAQIIFIAVHVAKLEKLKSLRVSAIECVRAFTGTHRAQRAGGAAAAAAAALGGGVLPGVLAALQDVATDTHNPGQRVVVAAVEAIDRLVCLVMDDENVDGSDDVTEDDFANLLKKASLKSRSKDNDEARAPAPRSRAWYGVAGQKLRVVSESLAQLAADERAPVRLALAGYCRGLLAHCRRSMQPSLPLAIDVLLSLSHDADVSLARVSEATLREYFATLPEHSRSDVFDSVLHSYDRLLMSLPRILNNIDSARKISSLNLLHGYITLLCSRPSLPAPFTCSTSISRLCHVLIEAVRIEITADILELCGDNWDGMYGADVVDGADGAEGMSRWLRPAHGAGAAAAAMRAAAALAGPAPCPTPSGPAPAGPAPAAAAAAAPLLVDHLLELLHTLIDERKEVMLLLNCIASAPEAESALADRVVEVYLAEETEDEREEQAPPPAPPPATPPRDHTLDPEVYDPASWDKDYVPGLYEGTVEVRTTPLPLSERRRGAVGGAGGGAGRVVAERCVRAAGVGRLARRLGGGFQRHLVRALCPLLARGGSARAAERGAGRAALAALAAAAALPSVARLVRDNADYFTYQLTTKLKKSWNSKSALKILAVVMEYSDETILDCLYGIVNDILLQSCDKYHSCDPSAYLQVFLTFCQCIQRWFPQETPTEPQPTQIQRVDLFKDTIEYSLKEKELERLMSEDVDSGKSAEELYKEDLKKKEEEDILHFDDRVTEETAPPPRHVALAAEIARRSVHFVSARSPALAALALRLARHALLALHCGAGGGGAGAGGGGVEPLAHALWAGARRRLTRPGGGGGGGGGEAGALREAFQLLLVMARLCKDFLRARTDKEVLPCLLSFLETSAKQSYLKDAGSYFRLSPTYKLQETLLTSLPDLLEDLALEGASIERVLVSCTPYLSDKQPKPLQEHTVSLFKRMLVLEYGVAWSVLRAAGGAAGGRGGPAGGRGGPAGGRGGPAGGRGGPAGGRGGQAGGRGGDTPRAPLALRPAPDVPGPADHSYTRNVHRIFEKHNL